MYKQFHQGTEAPSAVSMQEKKKREKAQITNYGTLLECNSHKFLWTSNFKLLNKVLAVLQNYLHKCILLSTSYEGRECHRQLMVSALSFSDWKLVQLNWSSSCCCCYLQGCWWYYGPVLTETGKHCCRFSTNPRDPAHLPCRGCGWCIA